MKRGTAKRAPRPRSKPLSKPGRRGAPSQDDEPIRSTAPHAGSRERLLAISAELRRTIRAVLKSLPGDDIRPIPLARQLGLNKNLTSRLLGAIARDDGIALLREMPGPAPLGSFLRAAEEAGASAKSIKTASAALDSFRAILDHDYGDKTHLDTVLASWLPETHARAELTARQLAFRGASLVKGLSVDVDVACFLMVPSRDDPAFADVGIISGRIGLRRLRPGVPIRIVGTTCHESMTPEAQAANRHHADLAERFSHEFSDKPLPLSVRRFAGRTEYWVDDRGVGPKCEVNFFVSELYRQQVPLLRPAKGRRDSRSFSVWVVDEPCRTLLLDQFVHKDIWPELAPELHVYDTAKNGRTTPMDEDRSADRMATSDRIDALGDNPAAFGTTLVPRYVEMLAFACKAWGWDLDALRGYRCVSRYPFYSSQVSFCWDPFGRAT